MKKQNEGFSVCATHVFNVIKLVIGVITLIRVCP